MQTPLFGHVPVLSQMTEVHAGFLMVKRSVSVCMYIRMSFVSEKVCNCAKADNICVVESSKSSMLYIHTTLRAFLWHMFLVCTLILTQYITCMNENEAHTYLCSIEKLSSFSCQCDYLTSTPCYW